MEDCPDIVVPPHDIIEEEIEYKHIPTLEVTVELPEPEEPLVTHERIWEEPIVIRMIELYRDYVRQKGLWTRVTNELNEAFGRNFTALNVKKKWHTLKNKWMTGNLNWTFYYLMNDAMEARKRKAKVKTDRYASMAPSNQAPDWFVQVVYGFEEALSDQHEEDLRELRKRRKVSKRRNKLLKELISKIPPYPTAADRALQTLGHTS